MTDAPTPPMTQKQRALLVGWLREPYDCTHGDDVANMADAADQLEADGVTIATLTAERDGLIALAEDLSGGLFDANKERDAAQADLKAADAQIELLLKNHNGLTAEIARLTAALATAREDGLREAMQGCQAVANEAKSYSLPQMTVEANTCDAGGP